MVVLLLTLFGGPVASGVDAKSLYSYTDEKGTRIITDNYEKIPAAYRAKVTTVEQESDGWLVRTSAGPKAGSTAPTFVTRCWTWVCSWRPSRR